MSYKAIGMAMGGRDHSTMINSKTQVADAISNPKSNPYLYGIYKVEKVVYCFYVFFHNVISICSSVQVSHNSQSSFRLF